MKGLIKGLLIVCLLVPAMVLTTCATPAVTNSESASRIAELEAKIRQLESDNQRLLTENQELRSNLVEITSMLENVQSEIPDILIIITELEAKIRQLESDNQRLLTENQELRSNLVEITSMLENVQSEIPDILIMITEIQNDSSDLATFLEGLPDLPPLPAGLTLSQINDAIEKARDLQKILSDLPDLPPSGWPSFIIPFPAELLALDEMRQSFIAMTEWMEDLGELPEFLNMAGDLDDLRYQEIAHLENINATMDNIKSILEEIKD